MIGKLRRANYVMVIVPFAIKKAILEPSQFFHMVVQRFLGFQTASNVLRSGSAAGRKKNDSFQSSLKSLDFLLFIGDYERVLEQIQKLPRMQRVFCFPKRVLAASKIYQYSCKIYDGRDATNGSSSTNVLYYVNNSLPYTQSGYTIRTAALTNAVRPKVDSFWSVTRLGYPLVIGKVPKPHNEPDELLTLIPKVMPFRECRRYEVAKKLLLRTCVENKVGIIQTTSDFNNAALVSDVAREMDIPWIYEIRGEPHNTWLSKIPDELVGAAKESFYYRSSERKEIEAAGKASAVIVLSELTEKKLLQAGIPKGKILTVPNGIDPAMQLDKEGARGIRTRMGLRSKKIVGTISSLVSYEGLDTLIEALPRLDKQIEIVIVGDGEDRGRLEELTASLGLEHRVHFVGRQPNSEIQSWYSLFDVFVVPRIDSYVTQAVTPIKPLNALAVGIPLVCSDLPALRTVTGGYARFFQPESPTDLAAAITEVIESPSHVLADEKWLDSMAWETNAEKVHKLYQRLSE